MNVRKFNYIRAYSCVEGDSVVWANLLKLSFVNFKKCARLFICCFLRFLISKPMSRLFLTYMYRRNFEICSNCYRGVENVHTFLCRAYSRNLSRFFVIMIHCRFWFIWNNVNIVSLLVSLVSISSIKNIFAFHKCAQYVSFLLEWLFWVDSCLLIFQTGTVFHHEGKTYNRLTIAFLLILDNYLAS